MKAIVAACCTCFLVFTACEDLGAPTSGSFLGTFSYNAFDTLNAMVVQGTLALFKADSTVSGHWKFEDGRSGTLKGIARNGNLSLDLNPEYRDNNLLLRGVLAGDAFTGTWEHIGYAGVMARGTFVAVRVR